MKTIKAVGEYKVKTTGQAIGYEFTYEAYDGLQDEIDHLGEDKVFKLTQRMVKVDASNTARENAKVANGHSTRAPMTEEQKAAAKAERVQNKLLLERVKSMPAHERAKFGL